MKKIVVTGATGFAGSHVLEAFQYKLNPEHEVIAACRNPSKLPNWFLGDSLIGDLKDKEYVNRLTTQADIICHTAAWAELNGTDENSKKHFYHPTIALIDRAMKNSVKRFIFLSSITSNPIVQKKIHTKRPLHKIWPHYDSILKIEKHLKELKGEKMEVIILRVGLFVGRNYSLGILPILLPRLKTHFVPWVKHGQTSLPIIDGRDIGLAFQLSATVPLKDTFNSIDIVGKELPIVHDVFSFLHSSYNYPMPHFNVSFEFAYFFARLMQLIHNILPCDPLIVPAIVLLLEETNATNEKAEMILGFKPQCDWKESIEVQLAEMNQQQGTMKMNKS